jgi:hypothetical protein
VRSRTTAALAWALWLATFGCCAAGLAVTLAVYRPLTLGVLAEGAVHALFFVLGFATVGLVLALRRPGNPIGWLYSAAGLAWAWFVPLAPWADQLVRDRRPLPIVPGPIRGRPRSRSGSPCPPCCCPTGACARAAGGSSWSPP